MTGRRQRLQGSLDSEIWMRRAGEVGWPFRSEQKEENEGRKILRRGRSEAAWGGWK